MIQDSAHAVPRATLRLFTGIAIPSEILNRLDEFVRRLKPLARIRWSPTANFHITTRFIGAWPQNRLDDLKATLNSAKGGGAFSIAIRGLGFFPDARRPRVFWTGVDGGPPLVRLAAATDAACATLGLEPEKKPYSPHLTLARIDLARMDSPSGLAPLHDALAKLPAASFGEFTAAAFLLYLSQPGLSQPGRGGSIYTPLAEFAL